MTVQIRRTPQRLHPRRLRHTQVALGQSGCCRGMRDSRLAQFASTHPRSCFAARARCNHSTFVKTAVGPRTGHCRAEDPGPMGAVCCRIQRGDRLLDLPGPPCVSQVLACTAEINGCPDLSLPSCFSLRLHGCNFCCLRSAQVTGYNVWMGVRWLTATSLC